MWREREVALLVCHTPDETPENRRTQLNSGKQILCLQLKNKHFYLHFPNKTKVKYVKNKATCHIHNPKQTASVSLE